MGGTEEVRRKLNDSYTPESYNTFEVQQLLPQRMQTNTDYLGRNFQFKIDETELPDFLLKNKDKYADLFKHAWEIQGSPQDSVQAMGASQQG